LIEAFRELKADENQSIREIGDYGIKLANEEKEFWLRREEEEDVFGFDEVR